MDAVPYRTHISRIALPLLIAALLLAAATPAAAQTLQASTTSVTMVNNAGNVSVTASDGSAIPFTATINYNSTDTPWLEITGNGTPAFSTSSITSTTPVNLALQEIRIPPSGSATITLTSNFGTVQITVSLTGGTTGGGGGITESPTSISLSNSGNSTPSATITLSTTSSTALTFSASVPTLQPQWLTVSPLSGAVSASSNATITAQLNSSGLPAGTYGPINITVAYGSSNSFTIPVTFTVVTSSVMTVSPTSTSWNYSGGTVPQTAVTVNASTTYFTATSNVNWILLSYPGAPSSYTPQYSIGPILTSVGLEAIYDPLVTAPATGTQGTVTLTDQSNPPNTAVFTVTYNGAGTGTGNGTVTVTPNPVTLSAAVNSSCCAQTTVAVNSSVSGNLSVALSSTLSSVSCQYSGNSTTCGNSGSSIPITAGTPVGVVLYGNPSGLSSQTYSGTLTVTVSSNGTANQASTQVNFVVGTGSTGTTGTPVEPTSLSFAADANHPNAINPQYLTVTDTGSYSVSTTVASGVPLWLTVPSGSGTSGGPTNPALIQVTANPSGLTAGAYTGTVTVVSNSGTTTVNVTLQVYSSPIIYPGTVSGGTGAGTLNLTEISGQIYGNIPQIIINASDGSATNVTASTSTSWLSLIQTSGTTPNASFALIFSTSNLPNGVFVGAVTFTSSLANSTLTVPVLLSVTGSSVSNGLTLSQQSVQLSTALNGVSVTSQLGVSATSATAFSASATVSTGSTQWLTVTPSGTTPGNITITANPSGLSSGTYYGTVTVTAGSNQASAQVTFIVGGTSSGGGNVVSSLSSLTFGYTANGATPQPQTVVISNQQSGTAPITFNLSTAVNGNTTNWLTASVNGSSQSQTPASVTVGANPSSLLPGQYTGTVTVSPNGGSQLQIPVTFTIQAAPTVSATPTQLNFNYAAGGALPSAGSITISGTASGLPYTAAPSTTSGGNWLSINKTSGTTPDTISVSVNPASLAAGNTYLGQIVIQGAAGASGSTTVAISLAVTAPPPTIMSVLQAASFQNNPISPGELISIFGTALGPATSAGTTITSSGTVSTNVGGVQVFFNGFAAPLTYVSATQINCVVPYEIASISSPFVEVKYLGQTSNEPTLRAAATSPGIFAVANGAGQGAILNFDNSVNSSSHPAAAGTVIQVYMTGEGQLSPTGVTGSVTCSKGCSTLSQIPVPLLPVAALINNQPATITFYGEAPNLVSGVMQVDVLIPPNTPSGPASLVISVGGIQSQTGVTVAIQ